MANSKLDWAQEMRRKGLRVFPLTHTLPDGSCSCGQPESKKHQPKNWGKHPLPGSHGVLDATNDPDEIEAMWKRHPNANIGVAPGVFDDELTGTIIIDLDEHQEGVSGAKNLAEKLGDEFVLHSSFCVRTQSGGYQLYLTTDRNFSNNAGIVLPGVDVRSKGGYGIAPGSDIQGRAYSVFNEAPLAPLPDAIKTMLTAARERDDQHQESLVELDLPENITRAREYLKLRKIAVEGEGGDDHTFNTVCQVKDLGVSADVCLDILMEDDGWASRCDPPWDRDELQVKVDNAYSYGKDRPGSKAGRISALSVEALVEMGFEPPDDVAVVGTRPFTEADEAKTEEETEQEFEKNAYLGEEAMNLNRNYEFIIPGWVPASYVTGFRAIRGVGKSTIILDMCLRIANDWDWHGIQIQPGWSVCYIVGEDMEGIIMRQRAWAKQHGKPIPHDRFLTMDQKINITDNKLVERFSKFVRKKLGRRNKVVFVLDTWQRMTDTAESQSNEQDIGAAVHNVEALAKAFNSPALVAFHPPKHNKDTIHGSALIENITHAIIGIEKGMNNIRYMTVERLKGAPDGGKADFKFIEVTLDGEDWTGKSFTAPGVEKVGGSGTKQDEEVKLRETCLMQVLGEIASYPQIVDDKFVSCVPLLEAIGLVMQLKTRKDEPDKTQFMTWYRLLKDIDFDFRPWPEKKGDQQNLAAYRRVGALLREAGPNGWSLQDGSKLTLKPVGKVPHLYWTKNHLAEAALEADDNPLGVPEA